MVAILHDVLVWTLIRLGGLQRWLRGVQVDDESDAMFLSDCIARGAVGLASGFGD